MAYYGRTAAVWHASRASTSWISSTACPAACSSNPYDILNRMNRRKLLKENTELTTSIRMDDYRIEPVGDDCFDLFYIAVK